MKLVVTLFALAFIAIGGCIGVPVPSNEILEEYIPEDNLSFLDAGVTRKEEVVKNLSEPASTFSNGSTWVYRANLRATVKMAMCYYIARQGECIAEPIIEKYGLVNLEFDDKGILSNWDLSYAELGGCSDEGVCGFSGPAYMIFAPKSADRAAKRFEVSGNNCAIYIYPHSGFWISYYSGPMRVQIEDVFDTWLRHSSEAYLFRVLPAASYLVSTSFKGQDKSIPLACNAGDVVYIGFLDRDDDEEYDFDFATESDGRAAIEDRRLILFEDISGVGGNSKPEARRHSQVRNQPSADMVLSAEEMLNQLGFNAGEADGIVRGNTVSAVLDYQSAHGLPTTGEIDEDLIKHLQIQIENRAQPQAN